MEKDAGMLSLLERLAAIAPDKPSPALREEINEFLRSYPADDTEIFKYGDFLLNRI
jgi:hypothetical protein